MNSQNTSTPATAVGPVLLQWSAPIHATHERSSRWYTRATIFMVLCAVYGIFTGAWSFALVILLVGGLYFLTRHLPATIAEIIIMERGFSFRGKFTSWQDCKEFWLIQTPAYTELHIQRRQGVDRAVLIHTADIEIPQIRSILSQFLPERSDQRERLVDMIIRFCKL